jgi:hypothetical protein
MQFELKFSANKHKLGGRQAVTYLFDKMNGLGVTVNWHEDSDDEEGERVDMQRLGDHSCSYTVHKDVTIRVLLTVPPGEPAMLLTPTIVAGDGVESSYPACLLKAGELFHLPMNIEMDAGERPNSWILRNEHEQLVLKIMICVN